MTTLHLTETEAQLIRAGLKSLTSTYLKGLLDHPDERIGKLASTAIFEFASDISDQLSVGSIIHTTKPRTLHELLKYWDMHETAGRVIIDDQ